VCEETPILTAGNLLAQQLFGWPMYLLNNVTGHNNHSNVVQGRAGEKETQVTQDNQLGVLGLVQRAGGVEVLPS
jgi:hypothetical protein